MAFSADYFAAFPVELKTHCFILKVATHSTDVNTPHFNPWRKTPASLRFGEIFDRYFLYMYIARL